MELKKIVLSGLEFTFKNKISKFEEIWSETQQKNNKYLNKS